MMKKPNLFDAVVLTRDMKLDFGAGTAPAGTEATIVEQLSDDCYVLELPGENLRTLQAKCSDFILKAESSTLSSVEGSVSVVLATTEQLVERVRSLQIEDPQIEAQLEVVTTMLNDLRTRGSVLSAIEPSAWEDVSSLMNWCDPPPRSSRVGWSKSEIETEDASGGTEPRLAA